MRLHSLLLNSPSTIHMLLTAIALLGFAAAPGGGPDPVDSVCADTPDSVMTEVTGGQTCTNLAAAGRCASTDDLVATMMAKNCKASCGGCGENRGSRAWSCNKHPLHPGRDYPNVIIRTSCLQSGCSYPK